MTSAKKGGVKTPFPHCQTKSEIGLTPFPPLSEKNQKPAYPPSPPCQKSDFDVSIFTESAPLGRFSPRVAMSVCGSAPSSEVLLGLSLALSSHDQFQASHWSSPHPCPLNI